MRGRSAEPDNPKSSQALNFSSLQESFPLEVGGRKTPKKKHRKFAKKEIVMDVMAFLKMIVFLCKQLIVPWIVHLLELEKSVVIQPRFCSDGDIRADATNGTHLEQSKISLGRSVGSLDCMEICVLVMGIVVGLPNGNCMYMVHIFISILY